MGPVGWQEMVIIFIVALVLFGPKKLPELGRTIGKAITEFRRASSDLKATFEREMHSIDKENESLREVSQSLNTEIQNTYYDGSYDSPYSDYSAYNAEPASTPASEQSTVSASATEGAESKATEPAANAPEGVVARTEAT